MLPTDFEEENILRNKIFIDLICRITIIFALRFYSGVNYEASSTKIDRKNNYFGNKSGPRSIISILNFNVQK